MTRFFQVLICSTLTTLMACGEAPERSSVSPVNWQRRMARSPLPGGLQEGSTYLSVYSEIYSESEHRTFSLTATVSMRNTSRTDTVYIHRAEYFNTNGTPIRSYFDRPIFIAPLETVEIIIDEADLEGGTGANFIFDWAVLPENPAPHFESVMISTYGQQGLSFTATGVRIEPAAGAVQPSDNTATQTEPHDQ